MGLHLPSDSQMQAKPQSQGGVNESRSANLGIACMALGPHANKNIF